MANTTNKMKILFVITKSNWGGAQRYVYELATSLPKDRFEPVVALGGNGMLVEKLHEAGVRTISLPSLLRDVNPLKDTANFIALLKLFRTECPDVVHLNSSKIGGLGSLAARIARVPRIIFTAHAWAFNEDRTSFSQIIIKILHFVTIVLSHKTIAVSQAVAQQAPAWGMRNKITAIYSPVFQNKNLLEKKFAQEQLSQKFPTLQKDTRMWIGMVAELHPSKGIRYAIEAMRDAKLQEKAILVVAGEGQERPILENLIRKNNLENSVFLLGFQENAASLMRAFDIFLFPSTTEAFGYVAAEAGLASLPVVASRVGGIPEVIEDGETGILVPPHDSDAIKSALAHLLDYSALRTSLGAALRKKILRDFSPEKSISATLALYEKK